ncbi:MAG: transposase [Anaerolineales bacterium]|nr:transposase [Anaerolineales bacterium]
MNESLLEKMGGERVCSVCGYVEREVYRLFCPRCMQRDRLSALTTRENATDILPVPLEPSGLNPVDVVPMQ